jgi:hypothetical protein
MYLVCWDGYTGSPEETDWLKASELDNTSELIEEYHTKYLDRLGPS